MRTLQLKSFTFKNAKEKTTYKELLTAVLDNPRDTGVKVSELRIRLQILDKLEIAENSLELEDTEANLMKELVADMNWVKIDKGILLFNDEIQAM